MANGSMIILWITLFMAWSRETSSSDFCFFRP
jgi:hypothetical protein